MPERMWGGSYPACDKVFFLNGKRGWEGFWWDLNQQCGWKENFHEMKMMKKNDDGRNSFWKISEKSWIILRLENLELGMRLKKNLYEKSTKSHCSMEIWSIENFRNFFSFENFLEWKGLKYFGSVELSIVKLIGKNFVWKVGEKLLQDGHRIDLKNIFIGNVP